METVNLDTPQQEPETSQTPTTIEESHDEDLARWEGEGGPAHD